MLRLVRDIPAGLLMVLGLDYSQPANAQEPTIASPQLSIQSLGNCRSLDIKDRGDGSKSYMGCLDLKTNKFRWGGDASDMTANPTLSAADNTLARLIAGRAPIDAHGNIIARGLNAVSDGSASNPIKAFWAEIGNDNLIRYANQIRLTTKHDGEAWESALGADCQAVTGYSFPYSSGLRVVAGQNVHSSTNLPEPYSYRVLTGGTLGSSPPTAGPGSAPFSNGTAQLQWINYKNLAAKLCLTSTTFMSGNAGDTWGANFNFQMKRLDNQPKHISGIEQDFYNYSGWDCQLFSGNTCNAYNMYLGGSNTATVGLNIGKTDAKKVFATEWALALQGPYLARDAVIEINTTNSTVGIGIGRYGSILGQSSYAAATYRDESTAPIGISLAGSNSDAAISTVGAVGGNGTAVRMGEGQLQCWGKAINACFSHAPNVGWQFSTSAAPAGTKVTFTDGGNLSTIGTISGKAFLVDGARGSNCSAPPTDKFRVVNGIVVGC